MTSHVLENMSEVVSNNYTNSHQAIDVVGSGNKIDDVVAISDGIVEMVVKDVKYTNHQTKGTATYGNFVKIKHDGGKKTLYAHLKYGSVSVSTGQAVSKGEKIGTMGATGNAYGTHLHFEVRNSDETRENPNNYLNGNNSLDSNNKEDFNVEVKEDVQNESEDKNEFEKAPIEMKTSEQNNIKQDNSNIETVDTWVTQKNEVLEENELLENGNYCGGSIVDGLKGIGIDSSFDNRADIALKNGIENYRGTYNQNVYLLKLLKSGKLKNA